MCVRITPVRGLLAVSLLLNAGALVRYYSLSQSAGIAHVRYPAPKVGLSRDKAEDLLRLLESRVVLVNASGTTATQGGLASLAEKGADAQPAEFGGPGKPEDVAAPEDASLLLRLFGAIGALISSLQTLVLLLPAAFGSAALAATYWQLTAWRRPLLLMTGASFVLVSIAQVAGVRGATSAVWFYAILSWLGLLHVMYTSDGLSRALLFWRLVGRMILHYHLVSWWGARSDVEAPELRSIYEQLHRRYAPQVLELILKLRGFYIKLGQVVSVIEIIPAPYRDELSVLQSGVPPKPADEVHRMIAAELGKPVDELFASFEDAPLGSASIGQVHRVR